MKLGIVSVTSAQFSAGKEPIHDSNVSKFFEQDDFAIGPPAYLKAMFPKSRHVLSGEGVARFRRQVHTAKMAPKINCVCLDIENGPYSPPEDVANLEEVFRQCAEAAHTEGFKFAYMPDSELLAKSLDLLSEADIVIVRDEGQIAGVLEKAPHAEVFLLVDPVDADEALKTIRRVESTIGIALLFDSKDKIPGLLQVLTALR